MKLHICYAHGQYLKSQEHCTTTATQFGGCDLSIPYSLNDLDPQFIQNNSYIFSQSRGAGYWIWKPYLILKTLQTMKDDDWLFYSDSGLYFRKDPWNYMLSKKDEFYDKGIATFCYHGVNKVSTKRDTFILMDMDEPKYTDALHRMSSFFLCRKTEFCINFVTEWLKYCCDPRIVTDLPNTRGKPNYPEFLYHRHDQSVMSLLCEKYQTYMYIDDLTQFSNPDPYIIHHRSKQ